MAKGGASKGENTKKAAGNAKKADAAAAKQAEADKRAEAAQSAEWSKGAKDSSKKAAQEEKAAEAARKKAEKDALLKEEEASLPSKPKGASKGAAKKGEKPGASKGTLDLGQLEGSAGGEERKKGALNASGIDNAIDALSLTGGSGAGDKVDRHPERRFKAAYAVFEERRLEEMQGEKGLRRQQKIDLIRKEFERHPDNPFNQQLAGRFDMSKEEMKELREAKREEIEGRLEQSRLRRYPAYSMGQYDYQPLPSLSKVSRRQFMVNRHPEVVSGEPKHLHHAKNPKGKQDTRISRLLLPPDSAP